MSSRIVCGVEAHAPCPVQWRRRGRATGRCGFTGLFGIDGKCGVPWLAFSIHNEGVVLDGLLVLLLCSPLRHLAAHRLTTGVLFSGFSKRRLTRGRYRSTEHHPRGGIRKVNEPTEARVPRLNGSTKGQTIRRTTTAPRPDKPRAIPPRSAGRRRKRRRQPTDDPPRRDRQADEEKQAYHSDTRGPSFSVFSAGVLASGTLPVPITHQPEAVSRAG